MSKENRNVLIYTLSFLGVFNLFFLTGFSDGEETTGILIEASIVIVAITVLFYKIYRFFLRKTSINIAVDSVILFMLSEVIFLCFLGGQICFFGIIYKFHLTDADNDLILFREKRDFALSMSSIIAASICLIQQIIFDRQPI